MIDIEGFEEFELVGEGSYGEVFVALDSTSQRLVAIKILHSDLAEDLEHRERFIREGQRLADINSGGANKELVEVLGAGEVNGRPYFVMSYADQRTLADRRLMIAESSPKLRLELALKLVEALATAMSVIHEAGLIHRDIKPGNILFASTANRPIDDIDGDRIVGLDERIVLGDFGLVISYVDPSTVHMLPQAVGTPGYIPPEAIDQVDGWTPQSDLYSATLVVVFALTSKPANGPWEQRLKEAGYSQALLDQIKKGLNENPTSRHETVDEWCNDLSVAINSSTHQPTRNRKAALLFATAGVTALLVSMGVFVALTRTTGGTSNEAARSPEKQVNSSASEDLEPVASGTAPATEQPDVVNSEKFSSCTVKPEEIPLDDMRFADIGEGGFVSGEGDCARLNLGTYDVALQPWDKELYWRCDLKPEETGPKGDYRAFVKLQTHDEELQINRGELLDFPDGPDFIEYVRWELSPDIPTPSNDYLGMCITTRSADENYAGAAHLYFNLDLTWITVDRAIRSPDK